MIYKVMVLLLMCKVSFCQDSHDWHNSIRPFSKLPYHKHYFINSSSDTIKAVVQITNDSVEIISYLKSPDGCWMAYYGTGGVKEKGMFKVYRRGQETVYKVKDCQHFSLNGELLYVIHYSKRAFVECGLPNKLQNFTVIKRPPNGNE